MKMPPSLHSFPRSFFFCCFLLLSLFLLLLLLVPPSSSSSSSGAPNDKVTVSLYYESLCPYCADFIVNHLVRLFQTDLISIVNLRLVPWGNAWIAPNASIICQVISLPFFFSSCCSFLSSIILFINPVMLMRKCKLNC